MPAEDFLFDKSLNTMSKCVGNTGFSALMWVESIPSSRQVSTGQYIQRISHLCYWCKRDLGLRMWPIVDDHLDYEFLKQHKDKHIYHVVVVVLV